MCLAQFFGHQSPFELSSRLDRNQRSRVRLILQVLQEGKQVCSRRALGEIKVNPDEPDGSLAVNHKRGRVRHVAAGVVDHVKPLGDGEVRVRKQWERDALGAVVRSQLVCRVGGADRPHVGAEVTELCYTLFETAKLAGVDPHAHVLEATRRAIASPGVITLPENLS